MTAPILELDLTDRLPTKTQWAFLEDRTKFKLLCGGLGSGKTSTGCEAFFDGVMANPGCDAMMVAPTGAMFARFMWPEWDRVRPRELVVSRNKTERYEKLRGGRTVWWGTAEVPESLEGSNLATFWGDEIRYWPRQSWVNMVGRLRVKKARRLQGIATSTPAMGWMEEEFNRGKAGRKVFRIGTRENARNLAPGYIEDMMLSMSARLAKALIDGEFVVIGGQVWEAFDKDKHVIPWTYDPRFPVIIGMDFGVRHSSVLLAQEITGTWPHRIANGRTLPVGSLVLFDELQPEQRPTERVIPLIEATLLRHGIERVDALYCDPAGNARDVASGMPSVHLLKSAFGDVVRYVTDPQHTRIPFGIGRVESALAPLVGPPTLYVSESVMGLDGRTHENDFTRGLARTFSGLQYPDAKDGRPTSDKYAKDGRLEHCADTLRYLVVNAEIRRGRDITTRMRKGYR